MTNLLSVEDCEFCRRKANQNNQLALGIMLGYFKQNATFLRKREEYIPRKLCLTIASELGIKGLTNNLIFAWDSKIAERYRHDIRNYLGYKMPNNNDAKIFKEYLIKDILPQSPSKEVLLEQTILFFHKNKIESFKQKNLERYIVNHIAFGALKNPAIVWYN